MEEPQDTVPAVADSCHCQGWAFLLSWSCPWSSCFYPCFNRFVFLRLVLLFFSLLVLVVVVFSTRVCKEKTWKTATCTTKNKQQTTQTKPPKQFCLNGISHAVIQLKNRQALTQSKIHCQSANWVCSKCFQEENGKQVEGSLSQCCQIEFCKETRTAATVSYITATHHSTRLWSVANGPKTEVLFSNWNLSTWPSAGEKHLPDPHLAHRTCGHVSYRLISATTVQLWMSVFLFVHPYAFMCSWMHAPVYACACVRTPRNYTCRGWINGWVSLLVHCWWVSLSTYVSACLVLSPLVLTFVKTHVCKRKLQAYVCTFFVYHVRVDETNKSHEHIGL